MDTNWATFKIEVTLGTRKQQAESNQKVEGPQT